MRAVRVLTSGFGVSAGQPWLPGLPHAVAGLATYFMFGGAPCLSGLLLATLASFIVYLPVTALVLNGGRAIAEDAPAPALTQGAQIALLALWTATCWAGAALAATVAV